MAEILLGQRVRDKVTGFEGVATAKVIYLNGCIQFCVKPMVDKNGKMVEGEYIDDSQLVVIKDWGDLDIEQESGGGPASDVPPENYCG